MVCCSEDALTYSSAFLLLQCILGYLNPFSSGGSCSDKWIVQITEIILNTSINNTITVVPHQYEPLKSGHLRIQDTYCGPKCCICMLTNPWNQDTSIKLTPEKVPRGVRIREVPLYTLSVLLALAPAWILLVWRKQVTYSWNTDQITRWPPSC